MIIDHTHTVATIRDKAVSAKNATVHKIQDTRDKHTSTPMAKTRFAESGYLPKAPPPPPPSHAPGPRSSFHSSRGSLERENSGRDISATPPPPPVVRTTKPTLGAHPASPPSPPPSRGLSVLDRARAFASSTPSPSSSALPPPASSKPASLRWSQPPPKPAPIARANDSASVNRDIDKIDWANLSPEDKQVFFAWLDEFFAIYIEKMKGVHLQGFSAGRGEVKVGENATKKRASPPPPPLAPAARPASEAYSDSSRLAPVSYPAHPFVHV